MKLPVIEAALYLQALIENFISLIYLISKMVDVSSLFRLYSVNEIEMITYPYHLNKCLFFGFRNGKNFSEPARMSWSYILVERLNKR